MKDYLLHRNWLFLIVPVVLVTLMAFSFPASRAVNVMEPGRIAGFWEGTYTWLDNSRTYPIDVTFKLDGAFEFGTVYRLQKGKFEFREGVIRLAADGWGPLDLTFRLEEGKPVLTGEFEGKGTYRLERSKAF